MPNHVHLLVQPLDDALSSRMQRLLISFTRAIHAKYGRLGALFQRQFPAVAVENDDQLIHLSATIHRNPVEAGLAARAEAWQYSSCREYLGVRQGRLPQPGVVLHLCGGRRGYRGLLNGGLGEAATGLEHVILED